MFFFFTSAFYLQQTNKQTNKCCFYFSSSLVCRDLLSFLSGLTALKTNKQKFITTLRANVLKRKLISFRKCVVNEKKKTKNWKRAKTTEKSFCISTSDLIQNQVDSWGRNHSIHRDRIHSFEQSALKAKSTSKEKRKKTKKLKNLNKKRNRFNLQFDSSSFLEKK